MEVRGWDGSISTSTRSATVTPASSSPPGGQVPLVPIVVTVATLMGGAVAYFLWRRRVKPSSPDDGAK